jgi:microcin C transport system permease protein
MPLGVVLLASLLALLALAELWVNSRALIVSYQGPLYFPSYSAFHSGTDLGLDYRYETNYRALAKVFAEQDTDNGLLMPPVPYDPFESHSSGDYYQPEAPSLGQRHLLGTDTTSRDILARLVYGTRIALVFAIAFMLAVYLIGIVIGCAMGFFGGVFDLVFQRLIEIWSNIPFLYMVIIVFSVVPASFDTGARIALLLGVMVLFSWTGMTYYMRTETYKEKSRDYVAAARIIGASNRRIIVKHLLPNGVSTLVTFVPFTLVSAMSTITALDFLGFGLPPPPSLGE